MFHRCWPRDHSPACHSYVAGKGDGEHGHHAAGAGQDMESYSGLISADKANHGNMFFWFTTKNPTYAFGSLMLARLYDGNLDIIYNIMVFWT